MNENVVFEEKKENINNDLDLPASTFKRFLNLIIDTIFIFVFAFLLGIILVIFGLDDSIEKINDHLLGLILFLAYYIPQESIYGRTLAKKITGTKVVNEKGLAPSVVQITVKTLFRFIPFEAFSFLGGKGRPIGWHDKLSTTRVVSIRN